MEALITGPFLLAIPLALWTVRLALAPRPRPAEQWVAWSMTLASMTMTMLCLVYCTFGGNFRRFAPAILVTLIVIACSATAVTMLWRLRRAWPLALLAMTAAWAANTTLTMLVVLSHAPWRGGIIFGLLVV